MKILKINPEKPEKEKIEEVAEILEKGGVVIFPTDTVYGIGAGIDKSKSLEEIYKIKGRKKEKPLILFIPYKKDLKKFVSRVPFRARKIIRELWPGAITLVFQASEEVKPPVRDERGTVGIRIPAHPLPLAILRAANFPLATTSANMAGESSARAIAEIPHRVISKADLVVDGGQVPIGKPSTVLDLSVRPFKILREGAISSAYIKNLLPEEKI